MKRSSRTEQSSGFNPPGSSRCPPPPGPCPQQSRAPGPAAPASRPRQGQDGWHALNCPTSGKGRMVGICRTTRWDPVGMPYLLHRNCLPPSANPNSMLEQSLPAAQRVAALTGLSGWRTVLRVGQTRHWGPACLGVAQRGGAPRLALLLEPPLLPQLHALRRHLEHLRGIRGIAPRLGGG